MTALARHMHSKTISIGKPIEINGSANKTFFITPPYRTVCLKEVHVSWWQLLDPIKCPYFGVRLEDRTLFASNCVVLSRSDVLAGDFVLSGISPKSVGQYIAMSILFGCREPLTTDGFIIV